MTTPAAVHDVPDVRHPAARRVRDVLRSTTHRRTFLIDDEENIVQALRSGIRIDSLYRTARYEFREPELRRLWGSVESFVLDDGVGKSLFGPEKRARTFALAQPPKQPGLDDMTRRRGDIVVLDSVRLMGNIGAVTRSACAFGASGVVLMNSGLTSALDRRLVRASRGLVFALPVILADAEEVTDYLVRRGVRLISLSAHGTTPLSAVRDIPDPVALLLSNERRGASPFFQESAARGFFVPMSPEVESLNVSVAAAIALYERRHRTWGPDADESPKALPDATLAIGPHPSSTGKAVAGTEGRA